MPNRLDCYRQDWEDFKLYVERKAEGRCILTNKNWYKLRDFHLGRFLENLQHPFGFLFYVKYYHKNIYKAIPHMPKYYGLYKEERARYFRNLIINGEVRIDGVQEKQEH